MAASLQILVRNSSANPQYFYLFQQQAGFAFMPSSSVGSSSLGCQQIGNYSATGAQICFRFETQIYAGAISTMDPVPPTALVLLITVSPTFAMDTSSTTSQPVTLTGAQPMNFTTMSINPLGLSKATNDAAQQSGTFAVAVPVYAPTQPPELYCGVAVTTSDGSVVLSSYVAPNPNQTLTCTPHPVYYVKVGYQPTGSVVNYNTSNAARCDFSTGQTSITVTYNADGSFTTQGV